MTNNKIVSDVHDLYYELGITEPKEIDLEAISFYKDAEVKKAHLTGCEARIIGGNDKAIITVNSDSSPQRQRFSIGHELGHWFRDRGKIGNLCSKSDMDEGCKQHSQRETTANLIASELIMPSYLLKNSIANTPYSLDTISAVGSTFDTSFMAALRKTTSMNQHMAFWAPYKKCGTRKYFGKNKDLHYFFSPPQRMPEGSAIHSLIKQGKPNSPTEIDANVWCKEDLASDFTVFEHAFQYHENEFITLVWWQDEEPIWQFLESRGEF